MTRRLCPPDPAIHQERLRRWRDDLDVIRDEMRAAETIELDVLAEHCDSIAADLDFQEMTVIGTLPIVSRR